MKRLSHNTHKQEPDKFSPQVRKKVLKLELNIFKLNLFILCNSQATSMLGHSCSAAVSDHH